MDSQVETSVLGAMWRYRFLVALFVMAFGSLGWWYASTQEEWTAEGALSVQDPGATNLFGGTAAPGTPERYVRDQAAILESRLVARDASEALAALDPPIDVSASEIINGLVVSAATNSDLITVSFTAPTPTEAIAVVNSVIASYRRAQRDAAQAVFSGTLTTIDASIAARGADLARIRQDIQTRLASDPERQAIVDNLQLAVSALLSVDAPDLAATPEQIERNSALLNELRLRVDTLRAAIGDDADDLELVALLDEEAVARQRLAELQSRRDGLAIDAELAGSGVAFISPAEMATPAGSTLFVVLGVLLGLILSGVIAYSLARRHRKFEDRMDPQLLLGIPLLADIPHFSSEKLKTPLPVVDAPRSAAAESFRFAAAGISIEQTDRGRAGEEPAFKVVAFTSADIMDGKSIVTANTAFALARAGSRVLVIDADFGSQGVSNLLLENVAGMRGMTNLSGRSTTLKRAVVTVQFDGSPSIDVLGRGTGDVSAADYFLSPRAGDLFAQAAAEYDVVLIDTPPLLRVAYATPVTRLSDRVIVVVSHGSDQLTASEMQNRVRLIGTPAMGYIYNRAPLRAEMTISIGSMANPTGSLILSEQSPAEAGASSTS